MEEINLLQINQLHKIIKHKLEKGSWSSITKHFEFKAFHNGNFDNRKHVDNNKHKHIFKVIVHCKTKQLNKQNTVIDFRAIDKIKQDLEGKYLNEYFEVDSATTECVAIFICHSIAKCYLCEVFETNIEGQETIALDELNSASHYRVLKEEEKE